MPSSANFITGLASMFLGGALVMWIVPAQTVPAVFAAVPSGFYPSFTAGLLIASGFALALSGLLGHPTRQIDASFTVTAAKTLVSLVLLAGAAFAMGRISFLPAGIVICLITLILMRENRLAVVAVISVLAPLAIWAGFELLLGRPLP